MLRNILLKFPGLKVKAECTVSSSCRTVRSVSPETRYVKAVKKIGDVKVIRKRSHSFPSLPPRPYHFLDPGQHVSLYNQYKNYSYRGRRDEHDNISVQTQRSSYSEQSVGEEAICFDNYDIKQYELEATRPKVAAIHDIKAEIEKKHREHSVYFPNLQPSNQRPFGSRDNVVHNPLMLRPTASFKVLAQSFFDAEKEENVREGASANKSKVRNDGFHSRKYSTTSKTKIMDDAFESVYDKMEKEKTEVETAVPSPISKLKVSLTEDFKGFHHKLAFEDVPTERKIKVEKYAEEDIVIRYPSYSEFVKRNKPQMPKSLVVYPNPQMAESPIVTDVCPVGEVQKETGLLVIDHNLQPRRNLSKSTLNGPCIKSSNISPLEQIRNTCNACERYKNQKRREKEEKEGKVVKEKKRPRQRRPLEPKPCGEDDGKCNKRQAKSAVECIPSKSNHILVATEKLSLPKRPITPEVCLVGHSERGRRLLSLDRDLPHARSICMDPTFRPCSVPSRNTCNACERWKDSKQKKGEKKSAAYAPKRPQRPLEPPLCTPADTKIPRKVCLPSKIRLRPPECMATPPYDDCKLPPPCRRADDCLKIPKKALPKLLDSSCPCINPYIPDKAPALRRLPMRLCDPPRICPPPPCSESVRADDGMKVVRKTLKPYVAKDCPCVEPPRMVDVPLKRLKPICPPEVCFPPRICPVEVCDECVRADKCMKVPKKKLPRIVPNDCPCVPEPPLHPGPEMKRLNLKVKEPERICPEPCICYVDCPRADADLKVTPKKLRPIVPADCPCIPRRMVDVPLKRLKCRDEEYECVVPDPCKKFPRADWGCWEYNDVEWVEVDEKCIEKEVDPCNPPAGVVDPCKKLGAGSKHGSKNMSSKRDFGTNSNSSLSLFYRLKLNSQNKVVEKKDPPPPKIENEAKEVVKEIKVTDKVLVEKKNTKNLNEIMLKKSGEEKRTITSTINLIKCLNNPDKDVDNPYMFTQPKTKKLSIDVILDKISASTTVLEQPKNDCKYNSFNVPDKKQLQRTFSTTCVLERNKSGNNCQKKKSAVCLPKKKSTSCLPKKKKSCKKVCPKFPLEGRCKIKHPSSCPPPPGGHERCEKYRTPVCCNKTESPYNAFSEVMEREYMPFTKTSQWTCDRREYGFEPTPRKFSENCEKDKNKKKYSTDATVRTDVTADSFLIEPLETKSTYKNLGKEIFEIYKAKKDEGIVRDSNKMDETPTLAYKPINKKFSQIVRQKSLIPGNQADQINDKNFGISSSKLFGTSKVKEGILTRNCLGQLPKEQRRSSVTRCLSARLMPSQTSISSKSHRPNPKCSISIPKKEKKSCKPTQCKKFKLRNCPPPAPPRICVRHRNIHKYDHCKKALAPFPAFSDCLNQEMEEVLSECPYELEKIKKLQPKAIDPVHKPAISEPPPPHQGKIDPMKEEDCIRKRLCMKRKGLSQTCSNFGKYIKPLRSKDYFKHVDPDCLKLEELKKRQISNSKFYKKRRSFSTMSIQRDGMSCISRREYSSMTKIFDLFGLKKQRSKSETALFEGGVNRIYIKNYHVLCKSPETNYFEEIGKKIKEVSQNHLAEFDENTCKLLKLRNEQWRLNNFKKWDNLNKQCSISKTVKRFYTSSRNKYKNYVKRDFCSTTKTINQDTCSEAALHRGLSTNVSLSKPNDSDSAKIKSKTRHNVGRSECKKATRKKVRACPKLSLPHCPPVAKRHGRCADPSISKPCKKTLSPYQSFSDCHKHVESKDINECPIVQEKLQSLQPRNAILPEIEASANYPTSQQIDPQMELDYVRCKLGVANEGITQTCSDFGKPVKYKYTCKDMERLIDRDCVALKEKKEREECYKREAEQEQIGTENEQKENTLSMLKKKLAGGETPSILYRDNIPEDDCDKLEQIQECREERKEDESLWQKICNYFKARPNCPAPDEWKKKALREKAEKAAAAAGLCLIDPKDLKKMEDDISCDESEHSVESEGSCDDPKPSHSASKNSMSMSKRHYSTLVLRRCYSRNLNQRNIDDINRILEEEEMKQRQKAINICSECNSDTELEGVLLKNKNQILPPLEDELEGPGVENEKEDNNSLLDLAPYNDIMPSRENIIEHILQIYADDSCKYQEAKSQAVFQEICNKLEHFKAVPSFEEIENLKTQSLVNELNKLLKDKEDSNKEE